MSPSPSTSAPPPQHQRAKVLVADDDPITLAMIDEALSPHFDLVTVESGEAALEALRDHPFACVMTDHFMPGMTGVQLLDASNELRPFTMRILMTASEDSEIYAEAVNRARVHRLLVKPLRWLELPSIIRGVVREGQLASQNRELIEQLAQSNAHLEAEVAQRTEELQVAVRQLEELALHDALTGLYNRRHFQNALFAEVSRAKRHGYESSLLFLDVDNFKHFNDRNGHPAGDRLLRRIADLLVGGGDSDLPVGKRASDLVSRYGGEEFVMLLPGTGVAGARIKAERVCRLIADHAFEHGEAQPLGCVSVSIGVASFPAHAHDEATLLAAADRQLYRAKASGRNRVCIAGEE